MTAHEISNLTGIVEGCIISFIMWSMVRDKKTKRRIRPIALGRIEKEDHKSFYHTGRFEVK